MNMHDKDLFEKLIDKLEETFTRVSNATDSELSAKLLDATFELTDMYMNLDANPFEDGFLRSLARHAIEVVRNDIERHPFCRLVPGALSAQTG